MDTDCVGTDYCDTTNNTCVTKGGQNAPCTAGDQCTSTVCLPDDGGDAGAGMCM
jgi:hypothetical protein